MKHQKGQVIQKVYSPWNHKNTIITEDQVNEIFDLLDLSHLRCRNLSLYQQAFVHRSYVSRDDFTLNDNTVMADMPSGCLPLQRDHNEELEFEGDAVLGSVVSLYLRQRFPGQGEGFFTHQKIDLVNNDTLGQHAIHMGFDNHIVLSRHVEETCNGRKNLRILGSSLEAFIGALFHDYNAIIMTKTTGKYKKDGESYVSSVQGYKKQGLGFQACYEFIVSMYEMFVDFSQLISQNKNYKGLLLDAFQQAFKTTPKYKEIHYEGPVHDRTYTMGVMLPDGGILATGVSKKKKEAEQIASKKALVALQSREG